MLKTDILVGIGRLYGFGQRFRLCSIVWNPQKGVLEVSSEPKLGNGHKNWRGGRRIMDFSKFGLALLILQTCYQTFNFFHGVITKNRSLPNRFLDFTWWFIHVDATILRIIVVTKTKLLTQGFVCFAAYSNNISGSQYQHQQEGRSGGSADHSWKKCFELNFILESLLYFSTPLILLNCFTMIAMYLMQPDNPRYMFSQIPQDFKAHGILYMLWGVIEFYFLINVNFFAFVAVSFTLPYMLSTHFWLERLKCITSRAHARNQNRIPHSLLRDISKLTKVYQDLKIINVIFNECYSKCIIIPFLIFIFVIHVVFIYCTVNLHSIMPIPSFSMFAFWSVAMFSVELLYFLRMGQIDEFSKRLITGWTRSMPFHSKRHVKYLRRIGIKCGKFIQRETAFRFVMNICRLAKNLLIIF